MHNLEVLDVVPAFLRGVEPFPGLNDWTADGALFIRQNLGGRANGSQHASTVLKTIDGMDALDWTYNLLRPECSAFLLDQPTGWTWNRLGEAISARPDKFHGAPPVITPRWPEMTAILKRSGKGSRRASCENAEFLDHSDPEYREYSDKITDAMRLLAEVAPGYARELEQLVHGIALVNEHASFRGASGLTMRGLVMLSPEPDWTAAIFAEELVHETTHTLLDLISLRQPFLLGSAALDEKWSAPFRPDLRPLCGNFHALVVISRLIHLFRYFENSAVGTERDWGARAGEHVASALVAMDSVRNYPNKSLMAKRLLNQLVVPTIQGANPS